ncbi:C-type lectin domain-containing protein [Caenorhabditis elegans]|nr:C-type lectin domain-containing protein [Caenorhabditis elegans]CCD83495.1 C-type lectin domain-containing protein [Caenorhabditis elegans]|eukprot:NP_001023508.1 C-type LECtin [Caenorhabditis elegans]
MVNLQLSYNDALDWCHYKNPVVQSNLATIPDPSTANFLASYARTAFGVDSGQFWIGLRRNSSGGIPWWWDDGSSLRWTNFGTQLSHDYVAQSIVNAKWNTFLGTEKNFFVCSYNPNFITTEYPTTTDDTSCQPESPVTLLFAYSNDLDPDVLESTWGATDFGEYPNFAAYATVRFDLRVAEDIAYHTTIESANTYITSHPPDPTLGFTSTSVGSDSLSIVENFYKNQQLSVCGSVVLLLSKRNPNETEISQIVSLVRRHHGLVHAIMSVNPSGGSQPKALYNLVSKTNGVAAFEQDSEFSDFILHLPMFLTPYPLYCANPKVSGTNSTELPPLSVSSEDSYYTIMVVQDHYPSDSFQSSQLKWWPSGQQPFGFSLTKSDLIGNDANTWITLEATSYNMTLDYSYATTVPQAIQIRIFSGSPLDYWLPYCD